MPNAEIQPALLQVMQTDIPWADLNNGTSIRVPHADVERDVFVLNSRLDPGYRSGTHRHSGDVFVLTTRGAWKYDEHDEMMRAGSYLFEPRGSVHTLHVPEDNDEPTEFWAIVHGALEYVDATGQVTHRLDAAGARQMYEDARRAGKQSLLADIQRSIARRS